MQLRRAGRGEHGFPAQVLAHQHRADWTCLRRLLGPRGPSALPNSFCRFPNGSSRGIRARWLRVCRFIFRPSVLHANEEVNETRLELSGDLANNWRVNLNQPARIYLVRHGETEWSLSGQHTGRTDVPLTAHGEDAARKLGLRLREIPFTRVLASPRKRARRTCELAGLNPAAEIEPDLAEWDYGDYEGQRSAEILKDRPGWNIFRDGCPHGEMPAQISDRADRLIARLRALEGNVAVFSHGHFGRVLAARWIGLPAGEAQRFQLDTASLNLLGYDHEHAGVPVIALWNSC